MRLGIDFGTTHTVASLVDRGNYPIVGFDWGNALPSTVAVNRRDGSRRYGQEAEAVAEEIEWDVLRSFKRLLRGAGPLTTVSLGDREVLLLELLVGYLEQLREDLISGSNLEVEDGEPLEVAVSVPAHATNDQRFLTLEAFRRAGFEVLTLLNEPSAAGFEYGHRFRRTLTSRREYVLVYDLGGGTFDASLIHMAGRANDVIASAGDPELGGDDVDATILEMVLEKVKARPDERTRRALLEVCRQQKEGLLPQSRRLVVDLTLLGKAPLVLSLADLYPRCAPLVNRSVAVLESVLQDRRRDDQEVQVSELAGLYVVGGASAFPLIGRHLRERFGQRVKRSPHPYAATAIGLACFLDDEAGYELSDCLTRHFGVWREAEAGLEVSFDPIFPRDTRLPSPGEQPLSVVRRYRPAHNVGHFRYVECGRLREGHPDSDVTPWDGVFFPFDPTLRDRNDLSRVPVARMDRQGPEVEERYECSPAGTFEVTLTCLEDGYTRRFRIARGGDSTAAGA